MARGPQVVSTPSNLSKYMYTILDMYCLKSGRERQSIGIGLLSFQNTTIFTLFYALNTIISNFKTI